ncbi:hypothetical protein MMC12_005840 [Toensbergia leucococca]|nr:hypothetical protein [Toensbergia leucococca]
MRTLSCPRSTTFDTLHLAIQIAFGWANCHLHQFYITDSNDPLGAFADRLLTLTTNPGEGMDDWDDLVIYEYDFGDGWEHAIEVIGKEPFRACIRCTEGKGHPIAEDAAGSFGWEEIKEAYKAERPSEGEEEKIEWYESTCTNGDVQGLHGDGVHVWDVVFVNRMLRELPELPSGSRFY